MFLHIAYARNILGVHWIILWSVDSDVASMCPRYCLIFGVGVKEFHFKTGVGPKKRFILMHSVVKEIGSDMCLIHPKIDAVSGCDQLHPSMGWGKKDG